MPRGVTLRETSVRLQVGPWHFSFSVKRSYSSLRALTLVLGLPGPGESEASILSFCQRALNLGFPGGSIVTNLAIQGMGEMWV